MTEPDPKGPASRINDGIGDRQFTQRDAISGRSSFRGTVGGLLGSGSGFVGQALDRGAMEGGSSLVGTTQWQPTGLGRVEGYAGRYGAVDGQSLQYGDRGDPLTVNVSPEFLSIVTSVGATVTALSTVYTGVLATFKNKREQEMHDVDVAKKKFDLAQAEEVAARKVHVTLHVPFGKKKL